MMVSTWSGMLMRRRQSMELACDDQHEGCTGQQYAEYGPGLPMPARQHDPPHGISTRDEASRVQSDYLRILEQEPPVRANVYHSRIHAE